jgi:hypothetical protein
MKARALIFVAMMSVSGAATAQPEMNKATAVMPGCRAVISQDKRDPFGIGRCVGLVEATMSLGSSLGGGLAFCFPEGVSSAQGVRIVVQYIEGRPARMQDNFVLLAVEAFRAAWPCKR